MARTCLDCRWLEFDPGEVGEYDYGADIGYLGCVKRYWRSCPAGASLAPDGATPVRDVEELRQAMRSAETCECFEAEDPE